MKMNGLGVAILGGLDVTCCSELQQADESRHGELRDDLQALQAASRRIFGDSVKWQF